MYVDDVGVFIRHAGFVWRPLGKIHLAVHSGCDCKTSVEPGTSVDASATMGRHGPGVMSVKAPVSTEHWTVRWDPHRGHEIASGRFEREVVS